MDKVIIDGVDVSGCKHYRAEIETKMPYGEYEIQKDKCHYSGIEIIQDCKGIKDCIYKQLKRLQHYQAEFEHELMNDYTYDGYISPNGFTPIDVIKHIKSELKRLEQENERLKEENKELKSSLVRQASTIFTLEKSSNDLSQSTNKLYKALQEIREIAKEHIVCDDCNFEGTDKCDARMCTHFYLNDFSEEICDKINEVIGVEDV